MQIDRQDLSERLIEFSANAVKFTAKLNRSATGRHIANQLMRASTSCGRTTRRLVLPRAVRILKEMRESRYWLRLIERVGLFPESVLPTLLRESDELVKIFAKSVITAKGRIR